MRTVKVFSTAGDSRGTDVRSEATTWGQLQSDLAGAQVTDPEVPGVNRNVIFVYS